MHIIAVSVPSQGCIHTVVNSHQASNVIHHHTRRAAGFFRSPDNKAGRIPSFSFSSKFQVHFLTRPRAFTPPPHLTSGLHSSLLKNSPYCYQHQLRHQLRHQQRIIHQIRISLISAAGPVRFGFISTTVREEKAS